MSDHSEGNWKATRVSNGYYVKAPSGCILAVVSQFPPASIRAHECEFNASLMAAAPALLKALTRFMELGTMDNQSAINAARAAIARAQRGVK